LLRPSTGEHESINSPIARRAQQLRSMAEHAADPKWKAKMLRIADE
jgi:hypothetical protein